MWSVSLSFRLRQNSCLHCTFFVKICRIFLVSLQLYNVSPAVLRHHSVSLFCFVFVPPNVGSRDSSQAVHGGFCSCLQLRLEENIAEFN